MHTRVSCLLSLEAGSFFVVVFFFFCFLLLFCFLIDLFFRFKIFGCRFFVIDFRDARSPFSAERRRAPKQNSTLSVCEACTSKRLFLLGIKTVSKNPSRKPYVEFHLMGCSDAPQTTIYWTIRVSYIIFSIALAWKKRVLITVARSRNGNVRWQRGGETVMGEKRTIAMLDCRAFSCRLCI